MRSCFLSSGAQTSSVIWLAALFFALFALPLTDQAQNDISARLLPASPCKATDDAKPQVNHNKTGGVRGTQKVRFIVTSGGLDVEGAIVEIRKSDCTLIERGKTDDWGEYYVQISPGNYRIDLSWREERKEHQVKVDTNTKDIKLPLDEQQ